VVFVGNLHQDGALNPDDALEAVTVDDLDGLVRATTGVNGVDGALCQRLRKLHATPDGWARLECLDVRQLDLLELIAEGLTNGEIGDRLGLAEKTVRNAVSVVLTRLGVSNRVEAAVLMARYSERYGRLHA
jgi:DNA-binding NarL/FixJ family response regulator